MNITIDDNQLTFEPGETILEVAQRNGIYIPTLCHLKGTTPTGACRICVVEVKGAGKLVESCAAPASSGMEIFTESAKVVKARKEIIRLMLASGNHNCAARNFEIEDWTDFQMKVMAEEGAEQLCPVWGDCKLQDLAYRYQVDTKDMPPAAGKYPMEKVNPFIVRDFSRCILCGRCVKACKEVQVNNAIDFGYRGSETKIVAGTDVPLKDSNCVFCGECVDVCPVGALVFKPALPVDRSRKVEKVRSTCAFCGVGCQISIHTEENRIVRIEGAGRDIPPNCGSLCVKGRFGYDFVGSDERLTTPLIKENGNFRNASWKEAFDLVAEKLTGIKDQFGPQALGVLTSARITNEENYIAQKFARAALKTNNIDHCARL
ncbi:MAG: (2Fe-2S)-binding protein [Desulfarculaceae bacterium]|nr:(2Fe-2S)-binding protein [Desulfarculaceae bacterium]